MQLLILFVAVAVKAVRGGSCSGVRMRAAAGELEVGRPVVEIGLGAKGKRAAGETAAVWTVAPTESWGSSRREWGSTRRTVCSFWLATTRTPGEGGAELLELVIRNASRVEEARNSAKRRDMQHLDRLKRSAYCVPRRRIMPPTPLRGSGHFEVT